MIDQQQQDEIDRSIKLISTINPDDFDTTIPADVIDNPGAPIVVNDTGDGFTVGGHNIDLNAVEFTNFAPMADSIGPVGPRGPTGPTGPVAGSANQVVYKNSSNVAAGSTNLVFDGTNLTCGGNVTAYSDESLKTNWRSLPDDFVDLMAQLKHGIYDRIDMDETQVGVSAQALQKFLKEAVSTGPSGILSVAYGNAAMVAAVKLAERIVALEAKVQELHK